MARPLRDPPIGFAHRGARAHEPENTLAAFALARRLGATGLESDVWITADGVAVLDHDGVVGGRLRRKAIGAVPRSALPDHIPTLTDLYEHCGTDFDLSLDVKDPAAVDVTVAAAREAGAAERLWLCDPVLERLAEWRARFPEVRLVNSTRITGMKEGPERRAASLRSAGVDAVNLHHTEWTAGLVTLFHRFGRCCFGWDAQQPRHLDEVLGAGVDGVYSDHVDRMVDAIRRR